MVRQGLERDNPAAYQFFNDFDWTQLDVGPVMVDIQDGSDPTSAAADFVAANSSTISALLPDTSYFE
jgi:glycine betaine/proline transport system substrate-binding protein